MENVCVCEKILLLYLTHMNVDITDTERFWFQKPHLQIHTSKLLLLLSKKKNFLHFPYTMHACQCSVLIRSNYIIINTDYFQHICLV